MSYILFAVCAVALGLTFIIRDSKSQPNSIPKIRGFAAFVSLLLIAGGTKWQLPVAEQNPAEAGLAIGGVTTLLALVIGNGRSSLKALALGCLVSGALLFCPLPNLGVCCLAAIVGSGVVATLSVTRLATLTSITIAAVAFCHLLSGTKNAIPSESLIGPIGIAAATAIAACGLLLPRLKAPNYITPTLMGLLTVGSTGLLAKICFPNATQWLGLLSGPIAAGVIYALEKSATDKPKFSLALTTVVWIGTATVAFGVGRGVGLSAAFLISTGLLIAIDADRALLSSGPLMALLLNRAFRFEHSGIGAAIDIGQNYALIGFALGALVPLLPFEWLNRKTRLKLVPESTATFVWLLVCFVTPCLIALFLAPKGLLGFVTGLGFCGFFAFADQKFKISSLALAGTIGAIAILEYGKVQSFIDLTRDQKIHWFVLSAVGLSLVAALLALLGSSKDSSVSPELA